MTPVQALHARMVVDPFRQKCPFSEEIAQANKKIFEPTMSDAERFEPIMDWLTLHQPCLFGRLAAKASKIEFCVLSEDDLSKDDNWIRSKIQRSRMHWRREAFLGGSSGF